MAAGGSTALASHDDVAREVDAFLDESRSVALWYLRPDYYPESDVERLRVLEAIQKHGDLTVFKRAARLQEWLCRHSSGSSTGR